jgi:hypothetical protein
VSIGVGLWWSDSPLACIERLLYLYVHIDACMRLAPYSPSAATHRTRPRCPSARDWEVSVAVLCEKERKPLKLRWKMDVHGPNDASAVAPSLPTYAVSTIDKAGSTTSVSSAGPDSRQMSASCSLAVVPRRLGSNWRRRCPLLSLLLLSLLSLLSLLLPRRVAEEDGREGRRNRIRRLRRVCKGLVLSLLLLLLASAAAAAIAPRRVRESEGGRGRWLLMKAAAVDRKRRRRSSSGGEGRDARGVSLCPLHRTVVCCMGGCEWVCRARKRAIHREPSPNDRVPSLNPGTFDDDQHTHTYLVAAA